MHLSFKSVFIIVISGSQNFSEEQELHVLKVKNVRQLHDFFRYRENDRPLISGHWGGRVEGYPENSIEAMEHTLKHTPAFFKIDPTLPRTV